MATRRRRRAKRKGSGRCKFGRSPYTGLCRKRRVVRKRRSTSTARRGGCKRIRLRGRIQKMCWNARKKRYLFAR